MAQPSLPLAIFLVFVTGGAVGGGTAAFILHHQAAPQVEQRPAPAQRTRVSSTQTQTRSQAHPAGFEASRTALPSQDPVPRLDAPASTTNLLDEEDPGTGAWLTDSLAQLEQKYQDMVERAKETELASSEGQASAEETSRSTAASQPIPSAPEPAPTAPLAQQTWADAPAAEPVANYVAETNITLDNSSTTHITQVNQTVLMGYVPLLVPVPTSGTPTRPNSAQVAPRTTATPWVGLSPWAPIDMSRHHNPWKSSRFP